MFNFFHKKREPVKLFYNTDVHCHILPGVDHGSQNVEESLELIDGEMQMGISRVMCTSHVTAETFENTPETLKAAEKTLKQALDDKGINVEIHASAEYRLDEYFNKEYAAGQILPLPGKFVLLENSFYQELLELDSLIFDLQTKRYRPILAHPERYAYYYHRHERLEKLHHVGVLFQSNILSFAGYYGPAVRDAALWLLDNNLIDMLGSDIHNIKHVQVIQDYLQSKDWRKVSAKLEGKLVNDAVKD